jgi:hypothetical protein
MLNDDNVLEDIAGNCPTVFGRNLFKEMFDGRPDLVVSDSGRQPANSNRTPVSLRDINILKRKLYYLNFFFYKHAYFEDNVSN